MEFSQFFQILVFVLILGQLLGRKRTGKRQNPERPLPKPPGNRGAGAAKDMDPKIRDALARFEARMKQPVPPEPGCEGPTVETEPLHTTVREELHPVNPSVREDLTKLQTSLDGELKPTVLETPQPRARQRRRKLTRRGLREGILWSIILERKVR